MSTRKSILAALAAVVAMAVAGGGAAAQSIVSTGESLVRARLLAGRTGPDGSRLAGLELTVAPGWKTYWRAPGETGIPPRFDWTGSANLAAVEVLWPRPTVFESFGMQAIGYGGRVVLPLRLTPEDATRPIAVALGLELGVCRDICVFEQTALAAELQPATEAHVALVEAARAAVPDGGAAAGLRAATCRIEGTGRTRRFSAELVFDAAPRGAVVVLEGPEETWFTGIALDEGPGAGRIGVTAGLSLPDDGFWIGRGDVRITLLADGIAADIRGCAAPAG